MDVFGKDGDGLLKPDNVIRFETFLSAKCGFRPCGFPMPSGRVATAEFRLPCLIRAK
jgi:hypothetical protein